MSIESLAEDIKKAVSTLAFITFLAAIPSIPIIIDSYSDSSNYHQLSEQQQNKEQDKKTEIKYGL